MLLSRHVLAGSLLVLLQCACAHGSARRLCGSALPREIRAVCAVNKRSVSSGEAGTRVTRGNQGSQSSSTLLRLLAGNVGNTRVPRSISTPKSATMQFYDKLHQLFTSRDPLNLYVDAKDAGNVHPDVTNGGVLSRSPRRSRREQWRGLAYHCCIVGCDVEDLALAC
ncbi:Hypp9004 [Branchiostoma lanceolatum]|uniref:Hypp9004 protein n=1 Tax=Branchiostoma lanceolatum TaxID=7740 RepID=A0A8J9ZAX2_BRALA|nr:Hypp9004 [Branchiostoma lanceolatum]